MGNGDDYQAVTVGWPRESIPYFMNNLCVFGQNCQFLPKQAKILASKESF